MSELTASDLAAASTPPAPARAILAVARKELLALRRDRRTLLLFSFAALLLLCALAFGGAERQRVDRERAAAATTDRDIWMSQGKRDPHAAAHFGQYAFKPQSPLALADPGVSAYVGTAIWLVAHEQLEARYRPARDGSAAARLGGLSLAFVLRTLAPLIVVLLCFSSFTGEREDGVLRQALGAGARPLDLLVGKALAAFAALGALLVPAFVGVLVSILLLDDADHAALAGQIWRLGGLALGYGLYLAGFVFLALGASALAKTSRVALITLLAFWLANCFLAPRLMTDLAREAVRLPTSLEFHKAIADERKKASFGHDERHPAFAPFRDHILKQYGVSRIQDLPVNFRGLSLRRDDENGYAIYDKHFRALQAAFDAQDRLRAAPGFLFPTLALQLLSTSFAGTDNRHQFDFAVAAEKHRREIQTIVSDDLIRNGRYGDAAYAAGKDLWARIPSFHYRLPEAGFAFANSISDVLSLAVWCALTLVFAVVAARRLRPA